MTREEQYRHDLVEHGNAIRAALAATTECVRAFIHRRKMQLSLYPLDFTHQLIADAEQLEREAVKAVLAAPAGRYITAVPSYQPPMDLNWEREYQRICEVAVENLARAEAAEAALAAALAPNSEKESTT